MDMVGVNHLFSGEALGGLFTGVAIDHMGLLIAMQVEPAPNVSRLDKIDRHGLVVDQHLYPADNPFTVDTGLEQDHIQIGLELFGPVFGGDVDGHGLGEVMYPEDHVAHGLVLHQIRCQLE